MKAVILSEYGPPERMTLEERPRPTPSADQVLVRIAATAINDWDWCLVRGSPAYMRLLGGLTRPKIEIPGVDVAGVVEAVGADVVDFAPGDRVYGDLSDAGFGGFAEYVAPKASALRSMPAGMSFEDAVTLPHAAGLAVQGLLHTAKLEPGHRLLVNGAGGGVGALAAQLARSIGVTDITGVDHPDKFETMRGVGYTTCIDYTTTDFTETNAPYDVVLDAKTTRAPSRYLRALAPGGIYATVGGEALKLLQLLAHGAVTNRLGDRRLVIVALKPNEGIERLNELHHDGTLQTVVDGPYPLEETPQALAHFGAGRHRGKVVIRVADLD